MPPITTSAQIWTLTDYREATQLVAKTQELFAIWVLDFAFSLGFDVKSDATQMTLARRLKGLRESKKLSQEQVAAACKVAVSTVSRWEDGSMEPRRKAFRVLAQVLEVSSSYLNGEVRALEDLTIAEVARRESFRLFAELSLLPEDRKVHLQRLLSSDLGPCAVAEWTRFNAMLSVALESEGKVLPLAASESIEASSNIILLPQRKRNKGGTESSA